MQTYKFCKQQLISAIKDINRINKLIDENYKKNGTVDMNSAVSVAFLNRFRY